MKNHIRRELGARLEKLLGADIDLMKLDRTPTSGIRQPRHFALRKIVDRQQFPPVINEPICQMGANEASTTGDHRSHLRNRDLGTNLSLISVHRAGMPSRHEIFLPSSISRPV